MKLNSWFLLSVISCTADALNGTDLKGKIVLCFPSSLDPGSEFQVALRNVRDAGASGLIFAQYTTDLLGATARCQGIACVRVDLDTGYQILRYIRDTRYNTY